MDQSGSGNTIGKKWLIIGGVIILILVIISMAVGSTSRKNKDGPGQKIQTLTMNNQDFNANPADPSTISETEAKALEEQKSSDREYYDWQNDNAVNYPWFRKLPLHTDKYYVYFDLNKKIFVGLLYPVVGDDIELMKADILKQLKETKGVPVENFTFEWTVKTK